ncbi:MAG: hypothetical protein ACI30J_00695 [Paludibacteraceae bacterium]
MKKIFFPMFLVFLAMTIATPRLTAQESPEGVLSGLFSVSATKQVRFSQGNLQCTIQGTDTTWAFAIHQYDMLGTANVENGALASTIDLFGWSGSTATAQWGISTSTDDNDYSGDFADWGQNIGDGNTWRTLTSEEWAYLRETRANAANLMGVARINLDETGTTYANGLLLLPDNWTCPTGVTFTAGVAEEQSEQAFADYQTFTLEQWQKLEAASAVFLPAAGYRFRTSVFYLQNGGLYWTSLGLYAMDFWSNSVLPYIDSGFIGHAVRLVQDYVTYTVTATCNEEQGSISGNGTYPKGTEVTLEATANAGYTFKEWSDGNTDNPRTITLTEDVTLTAIFQEGEATKVAQTSAVSATRKVLRNGQILILRNGNTYDITGQKVK